MSNKNLIEEFDKLVKTYDAELEHEKRVRTNFLAYCIESEKKRREVEMEEEMEHLKRELAAKLRQKIQLSVQLEKANILVEGERNLTQRAREQSAKYNRRLEEVKNLVAISNLPKNIESSILTKCENAENIASNTYISDSETSAVTCSGTDSDSWHLFPDCDERRARKNHSIGLARSSLGSNTTENSESNSIILYDETFENIKNRLHEYKMKMLVLGETCCVCELRIQCGKQALKCGSCRAIVHEKCKEQLAKPCIPIDIIKPGNRDIKYFCSSFKPMIPGILFHCVLYIEAKGLDTVGIFGLPVYDKNVTRLKELFFKGRGVPNLNKFDVMIVSAFLKDFLGLLTPPLIPIEYFQKFVNYANSAASKENTPHDELMQELYQLPRPNRDTLAFLIIHFQKVAKSSTCKMNSYYLAKIFTPILVENFESNDYKKMKSFRKVIRNFIDLPEDFWKRVLINSYQ